MKLDNKAKAQKIRFIYFLVPFFIVITTALVFLISESKDFKWIILSGILFILFFIVMAVFRFYFISFYAGPDNIRLRYKSLSPLPSENNSIKIVSNEFHNYKITSSFFGKKQSLSLFVKTPGGIAAFQKISLMSLNKKQIEKIIKALDLVLSINKKTV